MTSPNDFLGSQIPWLIALDFIAKKNYIKPKKLKKKKKKKKKKR